MSGNRKMLRDRVRKELKKAKKSVPEQYRKNITFSSVFNFVKAAAVQAPSRAGSRDTYSIDEVQDLPQVITAVQEVRDEDSDPEPTSDI